MGYKAGKGFKERAVIGIQAVFGQPDNAVAQVGYRRSVNTSVVAALHQGIFRPLESVGVYVSEKGFKLSQVAFVVEQALDKGGIGDHVGDGHGVRRADFQVCFQPHVGELHGNRVLYLLSGHWLVGVQLSKGLFAVAPALVLVGRYYSGRVQHVLRIVFECEAARKRAGHKAASVAVGMTPYVGSHQLMLARLAFEYRRIVADQA